jgi:hypothetical protein
MRGSTKSTADALGRQGANLAHLCPRPLRQSCGLEFDRQRETRLGFLARQGDGDHRPRSLIKHIMAQHKHWTIAGLLVPTHRIEVGPTDFAPQYSGHDSPARPSSAIFCSSAGSSLAHSVAKRVRANRSSFSAMAVSIAWLRFRKRRRSTRLSTRSSRAVSMVRATFVFGIRYDILSYYRIHGPKAILGKPSDSGRPRAFTCMRR